MTIDQRFKEIAKLLKSNVGRRGTYDVFTDFVEIFALALRNSVSRVMPGDETGFAEREDTFDRIKKSYSDVEMTRFGQAFAELTLIMEDEPQDVLGRLYMTLEISDASMGQFYTPYDVAKLMAEMQVGEIESHFSEKQYVTVGEPACGAGAFLIAISQSLRSRGINFQERMHVTCEDLSLVAVHMVYIHLTLLHIPAIVQRRNTLTMETFFTWPTPAHVLGMWDYRLRGDRDRGPLAALPEPVEAEPTPDVLLAWDDVFKEVA